MKSNIPAGLELSPALKEVETARLLGMEVKTLRNWRVLGLGPPFVKVGAKLVRYRLSDVLEWQEANLRQSTSDGGGARG